MAWVKEDKYYIKQKHVLNKVIITDYNHLAEVKRFILDILKNTLSEKQAGMK